MKFFLNAQMPRHQPLGDDKLIKYNLIGPTIFESFTKLIFTLNQIFHRQSIHLIKKYTFIQLSIYLTVTDSVYLSTLEAVLLRRDGTEKLSFYFVSYIYLPINVSIYLSNSEEVHYSRDIYRSIYNCVYLSIYLSYTVSIYLSTLEAVLLSRDGTEIGLLKSSSLPSSGIHN